MKASELVTVLQRLIEKHGDHELRGFFDCGLGLGEVGAFFVAEGHFPEGWGVLKAKSFIAVEVSDLGEFWMDRFAEPPEKPLPPVCER